MRKTLLPLLCLVAVPALAQQFARQGSGAVVTYVAGQAAISGRPLALGHDASATLGVGQLLATGTGSAELALTPGVMLRMDSASAIKLVALDDRRTEVQLSSGRAEIDLAGMRAGNELQIDTPNGVQTLLIQNGLYEFDLKADRLRVFDGKAAVSNSAAANQWIDVKGGHELALTSTAARPAEFDRDDRDGFASRNDSESARGGGYGYAPAYGSEGAGYAAYPYGYGFGSPYAFYEPYPYGFYPGVYGGYGFYGGYGYRGFGGYRGGFGGRGFGRR